MPDLFLLVFLTMNAGLFDEHVGWSEERIELAEGAAVLRGFALPLAAELVTHIEAIGAQSPFRHLMTPGGQRMSVAMTNCGGLGWTSGTGGYRYTTVDPLTGQPWPAMPSMFLDLAARAAAAAEFPGFVPDACLVNRYEPGSRLTMHQDRNERSDQQPIVSVSLGVPARFRFGGQGRDVPPKEVPLFHGDVVIWGGPSRMNYHGILPLKEASHPLTGNLRYNLTFRTAR